MPNYAQLPALWDRQAPIVTPPPCTNVNSVAVGGTSSGQTSDLGRVLSWLRDAGADQFAQLEPPTDSWRIARLRLDGPPGSCPLTMWNEDGEVRCLFDHAAELRFDDDDDRHGWGRLWLALAAVLDGRLFLSRVAPLLPWKVRAFPLDGPPGRSAATGFFRRVYSPYR